ncbi:MAG TPA: GNAT family N-acetyltransferase [Anaerolineaceae bacterium]|nr:GNAT family N-acetyltransferase [Anaerolineaceae bacterium]
MNIHSKPFSVSADLPAMLTLAQTYSDNHLHVIDLPWRFSSWALDDPENVGLWVDSTGQLVAWAVLNTPFWMIDHACDPSVEAEVFPRILAWADRRAKTVLDTPYGHPVWFTTTFATQPERIAALEAAGFASQADIGEDSWSQVLMERDGTQPVAAYRLPKGVTIRPLKGESEAQAYVDMHREIFETKNMTLEWRLRTLRHPDYVPELDLVAEDENGRLVAFCVCWINPLGGNVEPLGCHKDYLKNALGRTILCEGLRRLQDRGARKIYVHTDDYRNTAFALYEHVGFKVIQKVLIYRKEYEK